MHRALIVAAAASIALAARPARANPSQELARARAEYDRGNFESVTSILQPQIPVIRDEEERIEAHYLLGASYVLLKRPDEAKREFSALLYTDPDYQLDPVLEDPDVYVFFKDTRDELKDDLDLIRTKRIEDAAKKSRPGQETVIEREIRDPSPLVNFIPFGVGQFNNGQKVKGYVYLAVELLLAGTSLSLFAAQAIQYGIPSRVPADEADTVRTMQVVQIGTGAFFLIVYGIGVADAISNQKPKVTTKTYTRPLPAEAPSSFHIIPYASPDGFGIGAIWEF